MVSTAKAVVDSRSSEPTGCHCEAGTAKENGHSRKTSGYTSRIVCPNSFSKNLPILMYYAVRSQTTESCTTMSYRRMKHNKNSGFRLLMTQKEIAVESGFSQQHISLILKGDRSVTLETAIRLENATGICREAWIMPERHWNPYVPFGDPDKCMGCSNRSHRLQHILKTAYEYLVNHPTRKALQEVLDAIMKFIGIPDKRSTFRFGVICGPLHFTLAYCGVVNEIVTAPVNHARDVPHVFMKAMKDGIVIVPYAPEMLLNVPEELALANKFNIKSFIK